MIICETSQGIYETKIPAEFNAILQIGCVCKVDKSAKKRNFQDGWNLSELNMKTTTECPYLEHSYTFFYLYHRYCMSLKNKLYGLVNGTNLLVKVILLLSKSC